MPWTQLGAAAAGFSGIGTYSTELDIGPEVAAAWVVTIVVEDVGDIASVVVNGDDCGVMWTPPWRVDLTDRLRPGANMLVIEVANAWMNRLIAEAGSPTGAVFAPAATVYAAEAPVRQAGLAGAVRLRWHP